MASQSDATPWTPPSMTTCNPAIVHPASTPLIRGRGYFSQLGVVRTKPGRADSPATASKSCSDKLSIRQVVSLLLTPTAYLISPIGIYISTTVLPSIEYSASGCSRAFGAQGRMKELTGMTWDGGYSYHPFQIGVTSIEFPYSRRQAGPATSNLSAVFVANKGAEVLIGGVLQGRKQFSGVLAGSMLCKMKIWGAVMDVARIGIASQVVSVPTNSYAELKSSEMMRPRENVKAKVREILGGWTKTGGCNFAMRKGESVDDG
jgi:tRNA-specific adenosine deaminase 1